MTSTIRLRAALLACAVTIAGSAAAQSAREPRFQFDGSGTRVIEVSNLPGTEGCAPATSTGRITKRHMENGRFTAATFKDARSEEHINLPDASEFRNRATYERVRDALDGMLVPGAQLRVRLAACGAAGRIVVLSSVALVGGQAEQQRPAAAAERPQSPMSSTRDKPAAENDTDQILLRAPRSAAAPVPAPTPQPVPQPRVAPEAAAAENSDPKDGWSVWSDAGKSKLAIVNGMHYQTIQLLCTHRTGLVDVVVDDAKARYRVGSRQSFSLAAGIESVSAQGKTSYNDMDDVRQIEANIPIEVLRPVLTEMARGNRLTITTRAERLKIWQRGDEAKSASQFLSACSGGR